MAVLIMENMASRKWITEVVSVVETSTPVEVAFTDALETEGLLETVDARHDDSHIDLTTDEQKRPILLAVSDNGAQMTSGSTREFMALCVIAQHFGRPATPDRPSLDRKPQQAPQGRVPAPARDHRPRHPASRARGHSGALQHGQAPCL